MKRVLVCALVMLLALTACVQQEPVVAATTSEPLAAFTEEPTPESTAEPAVEAPYIDARKPYTYVWENERDRKWEEDIVYFAETFLDPYHGHPLLSDRTTTVCLYRDLVTRYSSEEKANYFDPALKEAFIEKINELILSIPEKNDFELEFGIYEAAAMMHDAHTLCFGPCIISGDAFPLVAVPVEGEDGVCAMIEYAPKNVKEILGTQLIAINEVPLSEVMERMRPLISYENEYAFESSFYTYLNFSRILQYIGVLDYGDTVPITVRDRAGNKKEYEIDIWPKDAFSQDNMAHFRSENGNEDGETGIGLRKRNPSSKVWFEMIRDGEVLYLRFNSCDVDESVGSILKEAFAAAQESGKCKIILVDFRQNGGGYSDLLGYFFTLASELQKADAEVYVLIDGGSFSAAIMIPAIIRRRVENARLIGTPGGQPVRFFLGNDFILRNSGIRCNCSSVFSDAWPGYEGDALMPDVTVYQTLDDFYEGYDSVLKYILQID